jgi:hypothetical protein
MGKNLIRILPVRMARIGLVYDGPVSMNRTEVYRMRRLVGPSTPRLCVWNVAKRSDNIQWRGLLATAS